jgi:DNA repair exonuclease SbcCD ATPase subunit
MDDLDYASARVVEDIQQSLRNLDEEEENLVLLKGQLSKVKRFREEHARKDDIIKTLRDRIASLEHEREFANKQSIELEEIMADRIAVLERSLAERDETEKEFAAFQVQAEMVVMERDSLRSDLENEMKRLAGTLHTKVIAEAPPQRSHALHIFA